MNDDPAEPAESIGADLLFDSDESQVDVAESPGAGRHWQWLAGLGVLVLLALSGVVWMLASVPQPGLVRQPAAAPGSPTTPAGSSGQPSTSDPGPAVTTVSRWPTVRGQAPVTTPVIRPPPAHTIAPIPRPTPRSPTPTRTVPQPTPPPGPVRVPNVVGQRQTTATAVLRAAGFHVSAIPVAYAPPRDGGRVLAQSPLGGTTAPRGSLVTIYVGAGF
jgi:hypothetical protein